MRVVNSSTFFPSFPHHLILKWVINSAIFVFIVQLFFCLYIFYESGSYDFYVPSVLKKLIFSDFPLGGFSLIYFFFLTPTYHVNKLINTDFFKRNVNFFRVSERDRKFRVNKKKLNYSKRQVDVTTKIYIHMNTYEKREEFKWFFHFQYI